MFCGPVRHGFTNDDRQRCIHDLYGSSERAGN
jgi:hypothetical protein